MLCDLLVTVLGLDWENRNQLLGMPDVDQRVERVKELLLGLMANRGIPPPVESGPSPKFDNNNSKAVVLRRKSGSPASQTNAASASQQQSSAPPQGLPEDLVPLYKTFVRRDSELTPSVKTTITRELTRLAKIPPQGAEYGVAKTYIEWLLALPWKRVTQSVEGKEIDLEQVKAKLDEDHEGLKEVKRRVIEYLAVYR
jgi:ATP-dependent Lon protease